MSRVRREIEIFLRNTREKAKLMNIHYSKPNKKDVNEGSTIKPSGKSYAATAVTSKPILVP